MFIKYPSTWKQASDNLLHETETVMENLVGCSFVTSTSAISPGQFDELSTQIANQSDECGTGLCHFEFHDHESLIEGVEQLQMFCEFMHLATEQQTLHEVLNHAVDTPNCAKNGLEWYYYMCAKNM